MNEKRYSEKFKHRMIQREEGALSEWLYEMLEPFTKETMVVQASEHQGPKDDSHDAWNLANEYRTGHLQKVVFKAPKCFTGLRQAVRAYQTATQDLVRAKSRFKAVFRSRGVLVDNSVYQPGLRPKWLRRLSGAYRKLAELRAAQLDAVAEVHAQAEEWLSEEAAKIDAVKRVSTVPGIGTIRAAQIVAIVVTPNRFRTKRQFRNYCGFGVVTRSSSDYVRGLDGHWKRQAVQQTRGLNRNRNATLKAVFTGAATTVIQQGKDQPLHRDYERMLASNVKPSLARLTLARRIAGATLAIWKDKLVLTPRQLQGDAETSQGTLWVTSPTRPRLTTSRKRVFLRCHRFARKPHERCVQRRSVHRRAARRRPKPARVRRRATQLVACPLRFGGIDGPAGGTAGNAQAGGSNVAAGASE